MAHPKPIALWMSQSLFRGFLFLGSLALGLFLGALERAVLRHHHRCALPAQRGRASSLRWRRVALEVAGLLAGQFRLAGLGLSLGGLGGLGVFGVLGLAHVPLLGFVAVLAGVLAVVNSDHHRWARLGLRHTGP